MSYKAAGCLIYSVSTKRFCFQLRKNKKTHTNSWGTWGGQLKEKEKPMDGMLREIQEELSRDIQISRIIHLNTYRNKDFSYINYIMLVRNEFVPNLNNDINKALYDYIKRNESRS